MCWEFALGGLFLSYARLDSKKKKTVLSTCEGSHSLDGWLLTQSADY